MLLKKRKVEIDMNEKSVFLYDTILIISALYNKYQYEYLYKSRSLSYSEGSKI